MDDESTQWQVHGLAVNSFLTGNRFCILRCDDHENGDYGEWYSVSAEQAVLALQRGLPVRLGLGDTNGSVRGPTDGMCTQPQLAV